MKAIFVPRTIYNEIELKKLNEELKGCDKIEHAETITHDDTPIGTLLIVRNYTRKDKLKKLKKISNESNNDS